MNSFLQLVAEDAYDYYGKRISEVTFVFPSRRASRTFISELTKCIPRPIWRPAGFAIADWMQALSTYTKADDTEQLLLLYQSVLHCWQTEISFEEFAQWGDLLLKDFDEIDKYHVPMEQLFSLLSAEKQIDHDFSVLDKEEVKNFMRFWSDLQHSNSLVRDNWLVFWKKIPAIYTHFQKSLQEQSLATEGQMYRDAIEKVSSFGGNTDSPILFCFVGFNALTRAEELVFEQLRKKERARFYWDAPELLPDYIRSFPNPDSFRYRMLMEPRAIFTKGVKPDFSLFSFDHSAAQARMIGQWASPFLPKDVHSRPDERIVIIPGDEEDHEEIIRSLGQRFGEINSSIGKPLAKTEVGKAYLGFLKGCLSSLRRGNTRIRPSDFATDHLLKLWKTPADLPLGDHFEAKDWITWELLMDSLFNFLKADQNDRSSGGEEVALLEELWCAFKLPIERYGLSKQALDWLVLLINRANSLKLLPFGKPDASVQITGILEARVMDYDKVILLSVNEGIWPSKSHSNSFIPYHLRKEYGMPVKSSLDAIYSYHFFRLLQRSAQVVFGYVKQNEINKVGVGEVSRFIKRLEFEYSIPLNRQHFSSPIHLQGGTIQPIIKEAKLLALLNKYLPEEGGKSILSPSALNTFVDCGVKFVYQYLIGIRDEDELTDIAEPRLFGKILHESMEKVFSPAVLGTRLTSQKIRNFLDNTDLIGDIITPVIQELHPEAYGQLNEADNASKNLLILEVLKTYLRTILETDHDYGSFQVVGIEKKVMQKFTFPLKDEVITVHLGGFIDRLDLKGDQLRVVDYKSGSPKQSISAFDGLVQSGASKRAKEMFQALIYSYLLSWEDEFQERKIAPILYALRNLEDRKLQVDLKVNKQVLTEQDQYSSDVEELLEGVLSDLFDPEKPFQPTDQLQNCKYCPFNRHCQRV